MRLLCTLTVFCAICGAIAAMFLVQVPSALLFPYARKYGSFGGERIWLATFVYWDIFFIPSVLPFIGLLIYGLWQASSAICGWLRKERT